MVARYPARRTTSWTRVWASTWPRWGARGRASTPRTRRTCRTRTSSRGVQIADAAGNVRFTSTFPGCYSGRWPHVHFEVYPDQAGIADAANAIATSQVALPQGACAQVYARSGYQASVGNLARLSLASDN